MSEPGPLEFVLTPSRARRDRLVLGACATAAVAAILASWTLAPASGRPGAALAPALLALAAAAAALVLLAAAARPPRLTRLRLVAGRQPAWELSAGTLELRGARAVAVGRARIVLQAGRRAAVVWRDAADPDDYRRLAARARWGRSLP